MSQVGLAIRDGVWEAGEFRTRQAHDPSQTLVIATCDPAASLLATEIAQASRFRLLVLQRSTREALALWRRGLVHAAGRELRLSSLRAAAHAHVRWVARESGSPARLQTRVKVVRSADYHLPLAELPG